MGIGAYTNTLDQYRYNPEGLGSTPVLKAQKGLSVSILTLN